MTFYAKMAMISVEFSGECFNSDCLSASCLGGLVLKRGQRGCFSFAGSFSILWIQFYTGCTFIRSVGLFRQLVNLYLFFPPKSQAEILKTALI